ncbi:hydroxymethylbilane synthase [Algihabitans albus]|uniref:hydroxymethylbilane synthase n=1 Tax=Algihabitans albus TaxID=2164067 RepID=UPI000E5D2655|nr:hydroxymethylbilane synthase [Algihabitans albus]
MTLDTPMIRLGTRGSPLALAQATEVQRRLIAAHPDLSEDGAVRVVEIKTTGDRVTDRPLAEIGGKGLFTKEIEAALAAREIDVAVHSMKDVPTWLPDGLELAAYLPREDVRDAFFSPHADSVAALPEGARVGSASLRRQAQLLLVRPDLKVGLIRGNVETRLRKLAAGEVDATLLAVAGLNRLGRAAAIQTRLSTDEMLPAVGQGAVGLEIRSDDEDTYKYIRTLNDVATETRVSAERACLEVLEGSCRTPIAALAEIGERERFHLRVLLAEPDGSAAWRTEREGPLGDALPLARDAGAELRRSAGEAFFERLADLF